MESAGRDCCSESRISDKWWALLQAESGSGLGHSMRRYLNFLQDPEKV